MSDQERSPEEIAALEKQRIQDREMAQMVAEVGRSKRDAAYAKRRQAAMF